MNPFDDDSGTGFGANVGSQIAGQALGAAFGSWSAKKGASINNKYSLKYEDALYDRARRRGLTPQEYYGSPAPGNSPSGQAGQVLGNQMNQMGQQTAQMSFQASENQKDRDAQQKIVETQTGTQGAIADAKLQEQIRQFNLSVKPKIAHQLKILENEAVTSSPQFIQGLKKLSMGTENMFVELVTRAYGLESFDDFNTLPKEQQTELMNAMLAGGSYYRKELAGLLEHAAGMGWPTQTLPSLDEFTSMAKKAGEQMRKFLSFFQSDSESPPPKGHGSPTLGSSHEPLSQPGQPFRNRGYR